MFNSEDVLGTDREGRSRTGLLPDYHRSDRFESFNTVNYRAGSRCDTEILTDWFTLNVSTYNGN